ncbi:hypothetical protein BDB00DRAFT_633986 [Zychaea mexicana]|uniref:uncharacterized protein n=1 Tax=Zychaea mexicana TaxID=64656 RepID=UPI0022FEDEA2|nr:uncharacterized protein BDB00DRAFT_633986 [Zychaea mexicana]KAI9489238.1 hypothetical protein BDB00DRAFT_633986 [Zychaea mexicana]
MSMPIRWSGSNDPSNQQQSQQQQQQQQRSDQPTSQATLYSQQQASAANYGMEQHGKPSLRPLQPQPYIHPESYSSGSSSATAPSYPYPAYYRGQSAPQQQHPSPPQQQHPYHHQHQPLPPQQQQQPPHGTGSDWREDRADAKRIRISRACDGCRRKKIKCDTTGQGSTCKNCQIAKVECTFNDR